MMMRAPADIVCCACVVRTRCLQRRYRLKFDGKGMKVLNGKHIAYQDRSNEILPVGSRVIGTAPPGVVCMNRLVPAD